MSRLITNAIRSTAASSDAITIDSSGKPTFPNGGVGKILQHLIVKKTDNTSTTSSSINEISSDFRITLTPTLSNSTIVCHADLGISDAAGYTHAIRIVRNTASDFSGTTSNFMTPDNFNNATDGHSVNYNEGGGLARVSARAFEVSGNTTARTYSIQWATSGGTLYLNRYTSSNYNCVSTFLVMEVAP